MAINRDRLPEPSDYFFSQGLVLQGKGTWRTTRCEFHGGSDSLRINTKSGAWVCMACGCKGGDVLSYQMQAHSQDFVDAAKALGVWDSKAPWDAKPVKDKPRVFSYRDGLACVAFEAMVVTFSALTIAHGKQLSPFELERLKKAAARINLVFEGFDGT